MCSHFNQMIQNLEFLRDDGAVVVLVFRDFALLRKSLNKLFVCECQIRQWLGMSYSYCGWNNITYWIHEVITAWKPNIKMVFIGCHSQVEPTYTHSLARSQASSYVCGIFGILWMNPWKIYNFNLPESVSTFIGHRICYQVIWVTIFCEFVM